MNSPQQGRTAYAHVDSSLSEATATLIRVAAGIRTQKRISRAKRVDLWRELAGVVSDVESVRLWLECGAPK